MSELTNRDLIKMHLEEYCYEASMSDHYIPCWTEVMAYCTGYYETITLDIIGAIRDLQIEGKIR